MRLENIDNDLKEISFEFFYWFSRFEFALKENNFLKDKNPEAKAEPSWEEFRERFKNKYISSDEANQLILLHPKRQFVAQDGELEWKPVGIAHCNNELCKVITMLKTIRNNLFHGGKHGDIDIDNKVKNKKLLALAKVVLDQLADLSEFEHDYSRFY